MTISYRTPMDRNIIAYDEGGQKVVGLKEGAASQFLGWGSFSGVDTKVIVHYPIDKRAEQALYDDKRYYENQLNSLNNKIVAYESQEATQGTIISLRDDVSARGTVQDALNDIDSQISYIGGIPTSKVLAEIQTVSYSIFREKSPVRTLGSVYPRAYVRGPRTIGGSMIFTVFHQHVLHEILDLNLKFYNTGTSDHDKYIYTTNLPDQLPPLDISFIFANEYGALSHMGLYGVEFIQEGTTLSIEDIFTENVVQYVARDMDPIRLVDKRQVDGQGIREEWSLTASSLLQDSQYRNNTLLRRNQFI
jgi:hypothetical protein